MHRCFIQTFDLADTLLVQVLAELKATDEVFAADYDLEQKSKLTELQLKAHILAQQRAMLNANSAISGATMEVNFIVLWSILHNLFAATRNVSRHHHHIRVKYN